MQLSVNGRGHDLDTPAGEPLAAVLRDDLGLTGTKTGCGGMGCGACTVLLDGRPALACAVRLDQVAGREVTTVEGLTDAGALHPVQRAFVTEQAVQCGWCTPAQVLTAVALLRAVPDPGREQVRECLDAVVCRCGTHQRAVAAVLRAAAGGEPV